MDVITHPIVVGIDLSGASDLALDWAAEEAARRRVPLEVVHAYSLPTYPSATAGIPGGVVMTGLDVTAKDAAIEAARDAASRMREAHPGLKVSALTSGGSPREALVDASQGAEMVVVGARGLGAVKGMLLGSVSTHVCAHAHAPVVVVHAPPSSLPDARVVVGVDGTETSASALAFAFNQAASRNVGLTIVHTWQFDSVEGDSAAMTWAVDWEQVNVQERSVVAEAVAGFAQDYPSVDVRRLVVQGDPVEELARQSETACLLVVGSRGRGAVAGWLAGSVSQSLLRSAHCPVAVVHPEPKSHTHNPRHGERAGRAHWGLVRHS